MLKRVIVNGEEIGRINYFIQTRDNSIFLSLFRLKPEFRNKGYFKYLFAEIVSVAKNNNIHIIYLSVGAEDNIGDDYILALYRRYGFVGDKRRMMLDIRTC
jgi:GNAT superfamily N-acetyltransferase